MGDEDETTVDPRQPLVDYGQTPDELTTSTQKIDMRTTPPARRPDEARSLRSSPTVGDMKAGLTNDRPKMSLLGARSAVYEVRAKEYGADKYRRGNYHGDPPEGVRPDQRVMGYIDAALRHLLKITNAYQHAVGVGDLEGARAALATVDAVASGGFPPSNLPDLAHAMATLSIAIECGVDDGLLPEDPGQPWRAGKPSGDQRSPEAVARMSKAPRNACEAGTCLHEACAPERLFRGYRVSDVIAASTKCFPGAQMRFEGGRLEYSYSDGKRWTAEDWDGVDSTVEAEYRNDAGLRRPDEPDYKPLT